MERDNDQQLQRHITISSYDLEIKECKFENPAWYQVLKRFRQLLPLYLIIIFSGVAVFVFFYLLQDKLSLLIIILGLWVFLAMTTAMTLSFWVKKDIFFLSRKQMLPIAVVIFTFSTTATLYQSEIISECDFVCELILNKDSSKRIKGYHEFDASREEFKKDNSNKVEESKPAITSLFEKLLKFFGGASEKNQ